MSFCVNCGTKIEEGMKFCPNCGTAAPEAAKVIRPANAFHALPASGEVNYVQQTVSRSSMERQVALREVKEAYDYFNQMRPEYERVDYLDSEKARLGNRSNARLKWGIPLGIIGFFIASWTVMLGGYTGATAFKIWACIMAIPVILIVWHIVMNIIWNRQQVKTDAEYAVLVDDLYNYYTKYVGSPIGYDYSHPDVVFHIGQMIDSGRASTIPQAINCMLHDAEREADELHMMMIERQARATARGATAAAIFAAASWFF